MRLGRVSAMLSCLLLLAGCRPQDQKTESVTPATFQEVRKDWPPELKAQIDSGNAAYSAKDYQGALDHYRSALQAQGDLTAAWFGIYMAQQALGNAAAADSAMAKVRELAPGATLVHPAPSGKK